PDVDVQVAVLAHRGDRAGRHEQEPLQGHRDAVVTQVYLGVLQGQHAQGLHAVEGAPDVLGGGAGGLVVLPRRGHQVDRVLVAVDVDGDGQEVGVGADGVGQGLLVEDERGGRLDLQL